MSTIWTPDAPTMRSVQHKALGSVLRWMADKQIMFRVLSIDKHVNIGDDRGTMISLPREYADRFPQGANVWAFRNYGDVGLAARTSDGQIRVLMMPA